MPDVMAAVDCVVAQGYVDENRLGVTGGSYGGFMTNWIIGHTDRFKRGRHPALRLQPALVLRHQRHRLHFGEYEFGGTPGRSASTS